MKIEKYEGWNMMEIKVLLTCKWHYGIPNGDEEVSVLVDEFDIENEQEAKFVIKNTLIKYGVSPQTLQFDSKDYKNDYMFKGEIGRFDRVAGGFNRVYKQMCEIEVSMQYVRKHRNRIYKLEEISYEKI